MIYVVEAGDFVKIGVCENLEQRIKSLQTGNPLIINPLRIIRTKDLSFDFLLEKALHHRYANAKTPANNEWFHKAGIKELLMADTNSIKAIAATAHLNTDYVLHISGFSNEIATELHDYLDCTTINILYDNCICSFEDLEMFLSGSHMRHGIGERRYAKIKKAYQMYKEDK